MCVHPFIQFIILICLLACTIHASSTIGDELITMGDVNVLELIDKGVEVEHPSPMQRRQITEKFKRWLDEGQYGKIASYFSALKGTAMECLCPLLSSINHFKEFAQGFRVHQIMPYIF